MKADAIKDGVKPTKGMWLVNTETHIAFGPIEQVQRTAIAWRSLRFGSLVKTDHETIHHGPYTYVEAPEGQVPEGYNLQEGAALP